MSTVGQRERATQNRVVRLFTKQLGYRYLGNWHDRVGNSNIEEPKRIALYKFTAALIRAYANIAKEAQKELEIKIAIKYQTLTKEEVRTLVVDDKWLSTLTSDVQGELNQISQALTRRIKVLAEHYVAPLPKLSEDVEALSDRIDEHLRKIGFVW
ncbi:hypothetical protein [Ktedonobacter racemifer]|uniref:hypothetical protein n=1 Tax=Ktedonobacter racemifer TaxID=363277 RepID=UPI0003182A00|nr:hypothetical protein [Ktedonobacter racemifer]